MAAITKTRIIKMEILCNFSLIAILDSNHWRHKKLSTIENVGFDLAIDADTLESNAV
jgi:hypothetical protein